MNAKRREVIERLLETIHHGNIVVKDKLPSERDLSNLIGESRTLIREALISLEAMGVIEIRERQGIFISSREENEAKMLLHQITQWPADALSQTMELRQLIDPAAAAMAAVRRTDEHVERLSQCLANMKTLLHDGDPEAAKMGAYWNTIYHSIILSATGNTYMARMYESILSSIEHGMSVMRHGTPPSERGGRHVSYREHETLFIAIRDHKMDEAEQIAEKHLTHTVTAMVSLGQIVPSSDLYGKKMAGRLRFDAPPREK